MFDGTGAGESLRGRIVADLRGQIGLGHLAPGAKLNERELCERFGVSRPTVREAMRQLEAEGFITLEAHKGAAVSQMSYERAVHLFELRTSLEALACELCAQRATVEAKRQIGAAVEAVAQAMQGDDLESVIASKDAFYAALLNGAGNPDLTAMLQLLHVRISILRRYSLSSADRNPRSLEEIRAIQRAIVSGDPEKAGMAARYHVSQARNVALPRIFEHQPTPEVLNRDEVHRELK